MLLYMAAWTGETMPEGIVEVSSDWDERLEPAFLSTALQARMAGQISQRTWLHIAQRYDLLPDGVSIDDEIAQLLAEGPEPFGGGMDSELMATGGDAPQTQGRLNAV